jgi:hypothetical protein
MEKVRQKRVSMIRLFAELIEETIILTFLEVKLAALEIKRNIRSAEKGGAMMAVGGALLLFAMVVFVGTAVAALALFLPVWLSALIVALGLSFFGIAFLFSGLGLLKGFSLFPAETLVRVENIAQKVRKVSAQHQEAVARTESERALERSAARTAETVTERTAEMARTAERAASRAAERAAGKVAERVSPLAPERVSQLKFPERAPGVPERRRPERSQKKRALGLPERRRAAW